MKPILRLVALIAFGPVASLAACEGEPPVVYPQSPPGTASEAVPPADMAEVTTAPPEASAPGMPPCMTQSPAPPASASVAPSASAASASASAPAVSPESPPAVHEGNVVGSITSKPTALAAYGAVYLEDGPKEGAPEHPSSVTIANRQMAFVPFVRVVAAGGRVVFSNADPFPHNVFSPDNEKFNMGIIAQNAGHARVFPNPGAYSLLCNLHPGMLGYLLVTPSAWFARTDAKGSFALKQVPAGTYKLTAWAPRQTPVTQSITVADGDTTVNFDLHR
jgi:plastocyanin